MKCSELLRILKKEGWYIVKQTGSHITMRHPAKENQLNIPYHASKEVKKGLLIAIFKESGIKTGKR